VTPTPEDDDARRYYVRSKGSASVAIGRVAGNVFLRFLTDDAKKWRLPPFCVVVALVTTALIRGPGGSQDQLTGPYLLAGVAVVAATLRAWAVVESDRALVSITLVALICAVAALTWTEHLRSHGEVAVTDRVHHTDGGRRVADGGVVSFEIREAPQRTHLRLTFAIEDAEPEAQSCRPETTLEVRLGQAGARTVEGAEIDLALGGRPGDILGTILVRTGEGCLMDVSVESAVVHG